MKEEEGEKKNISNDANKYTKDASSDFQFFASPAPLGYDATARQLDSGASLAWNLNDVTNSRHPETLGDSLWRKSELCSEAKNMGCRILLGAGDSTGTKIEMLFINETTSADYEIPGNRLNSKSEYTYRGIEIQNRRS